MASLHANREIRDFLTDNGVKIRHNQAEGYGMVFNYSTKDTTHKTHCSVCGLPMFKGERQVEFMAGRYGPNTIPYLHHLHKACFLRELVRIFQEEGDDLLKSIQTLRPLVIDDLIPKAMLARLRG